MKTNTSIKSMQLTWLLGAMLISILVFIYSKTYNYDPSRYFKNVELLRDIKQRDAHWELDAMKSKIGINNNYDHLAALLVELNALQQELDTIKFSQSTRDNDKLQNDINVFTNALKTKSDMIEHFKSHNAVLRNSMAFLPTAAEDVKNIMKQDKQLHPSVLKSIADDVNKVLLSSLEYSMAASDNSDYKDIVIESELNHLLSQTKNLSTEIRDAVSIFSAHVQTILLEFNVVNDLLNNIITAPTSAHIDEINNFLNHEERMASEKAQKYRLFLLIFSAGLTVFLLFAAVRLVRNHVVIKNINAQLQNSNDTLEQRVQQRTEELKEVQAQLITTARQAGMAEIATNVLHNIGNVLNSVNVSAMVISNQLKASTAPDLGDVVKLMDKHASDLGDFITRDEKGKILPNYIAALAKNLVEEQKSMTNELGLLSKGINHIMEIVATQQTYAGASRVLEPILVSSLLEDALRMSADSLSRHNVFVEKEFDNVPSLLLDKHKLLQILINLINNAKQAMINMQDRKPLIRLRLYTSQDNWLHIEVVDNGNGIAPENLTRIFSHGFTTRQNGHGFGLHSCVLAAKDMGGSLTASSAGQGKGATFLLKLPMQVSNESKI